ncbi:MAG TPA: PLP-dependent aminotransferase family protein, partial [Blastocatellia bacterium]|nr:PLP-dependent aminotransferase family protein [Blastocatellia bacterium]
MILALDRQSPVPLYTQIATKLRAMIAAGTIKVGDRLPAHRALAETLGVNRTTVMTAYDELLADGLIGSRIGSGTYVIAKPLQAAAMTNIQTPTLAPLNWDAMLTDLGADEWLAQRGLPQGREEILFTMALPNTSLFPLDAFRHSVERVMRREGRQLLQLGTSRGYEPLQQYLLEQAALVGIRATPEEILITSGCQQALDQLRQIMLQPGDEVVLENPTYPGAVTLFCRAPYKPLSVAVNKDGLDLDALEAILQQRRPKMIYVVPTFHNPTGATMDIASRRRLLDLAAQYRVPIIEDDIYHDLRYEGAAVPSLKALDPYGVVIHINSFSKVAFPGLRVGWVIAPRRVIEHLHTLKQRTELHGNLLAQAALCDFARHGELAKHIQRCRRSYTQKRDAMLGALQQHFPTETQWTKPDGGLAIWVKLPAGLDAQRLLLKSQEQQVSFTPGVRFYVNGACPDTLRLSFSLASLAQIEEGIKRLGRIVTAQLAQAKRQ